MSSEATETSSADQPEEEGVLKPLSPAARRRVQSLYEHAQSLIKGSKYDFDYVHTLIGQCVSLDPGNLVYVEAMFENLHRKFSGNKKAGKGSPQKGALKKLIGKKEWREALKLGPEVLQTNPWDVAVLRQMAEACENMRLNEVELRYLKNALDAAPKDTDVNRHCAKSLARMGQFDMAIACWHRVEEANKGDNEAKKEISMLTVEKTRGVLGIEEEDEGENAGEQRTKPRPKPAEPAPEPEKKEEAPARPAIELTPRQELEREVANAPVFPEPYLDLAKIHREEGRMRDALNVLKKAQEVLGSGEMKIVTALEETSIAAAQQQLAIATKRAAEDDSEEARELAQKLKADLNRLELQVYADRSNRHPDDKRVRLELGHRLKRAGNYEEALAELEIAAEEPKYVAGAELIRGECFQQLKQYKPAIKAYQKSLAAGGATEIRQLALYRAAVLAAALKQPEAAEKWFAELVEQNPKFRDAKARLDKIRSIRDSG